MEKPGRPAKCPCPSAQTHRRKSIRPHEKPRRWIQVQGTRDWSAQLDARESAALSALPDVFLLGASRFVEYKRLEDTIAAGVAARLPVVIAGSGPEERRLREFSDSAPVDVHVILKPSDAMLAALMQRAAVYVFPPVEDFGIMPVEAMALGTPVLVNALGGASESVINGETGIHVRNFHDMREVATAIADARRLSKSAILARARDFSAEAFRARVRRWVTPLDVVSARDRERSSRPLARRLSQRGGEGSVSVAG